MLRFLSNKNFYLIFLLISCSYYLTDYFQIYLLDSIGTSSSKGFFASYIYLPNGLRVLFVFVFGLAVIPGLLFAHLLTGYINLNEFNMLLLSTSILSTLSPILAIYIVYKKFNVLSTEIDIKKIFYVAILSSVFNSLFSVLTRIFFNFYSDKIFTILFLKFLIGDILGVLFIFLFFIIINKLINYKYLG